MNAIVLSLEICTSLLQSTLKIIISSGLQAPLFFAINSNSSNAPNMRTTAQVFGGEPDENGNKVRPLHAYTIVDAIHDGNVLPF